MPPSARISFAIYCYVPDSLTVDLKPFPISDTKVYRLVNTPSGGTAGRLATPSECNPNRLTGSSHLLQILIPGIYGFMNDSVVVAALGANLKPWAKRGKDPWPAPPPPPPPDTADLEGDRVRNALPIEFLHSGDGGLLLVLQEWWSSRRKSCL